MSRRRGLWAELHNCVGILSLLPLILLAATGVMLGFERQLAPLVYRVTASRPITMSRSFVSVHQPGALTITPDQAVAIARGLVPNAVPYRVQMPRYGGVYQVALSASHGGLADDRRERVDRVQVDGRGTRAGAHEKTRAMRKAAAAARPPIRVVCKALRIGRVPV